MSAIPRNKAITFTKIAHATFQLEESRGHLKWKVTDLVRKAKVSRSTIYEYMGSSKKEILLSSLRHFNDEFFGFSLPENSESMANNIKSARERMIEYPEAILFYQKWRVNKSWLQAEFIEVEKKFRVNLKKSCPQLTERQILAVHAFIHGLVTAPFLTSKEATDIFTEVWNKI